MVVEENGRQLSSIQQQDWELDLALELETGTARCY